MSSSAAYKRVQFLGEGAHGSVHLYESPSGDMVAIKETSLTNSSGTRGLSMEAIRELKTLQLFSHENIVSLEDVFIEHGSLKLVLEYAESDIEHLIRDRSRPLLEADWKTLLRQMLLALECCHAQWVLHRDIKPANWLVKADGTVKLADFGLARGYGDSDPHLEANVFTVWYRPPELLFGATCYGPAVDIWALGVVFAQMMLGTPLFSGETSFEVLTQIFAVLGTPDKGWLGVESLPDYIAFSKIEPPDLKLSFKGASSHALDILKQMLQLNPKKRPSASELLKHSFFSADPKPTPRAELPFSPRKK